MYEDAIAAPKTLGLEPAQSESGTHNNAAETTTPTLLCSKNMPHANRLDTAATSSNSGGKVNAH
jgi:hypothetical protein